MYVSMSKHMPKMYFSHICLCLCCLKCLFSESIPFLFHLRRSYSSGGRRILHVCACVRIHACIYTCMYSCIYTHTHIHTQILAEEGVSMNDMMGMSTNDQGVYIWTFVCALL